MVYQEYPRHLHGPQGAYCVVQNEAERDQKLAEGWQLWPVSGAAPEPSVDLVVDDGVTPEMSATVGDVEAPAVLEEPSPPVASDAPKKRRGRPPKVQA